MKNQKNEKGKANASGVICQANGVINKGESYIYLSVDNLWWDLSEAINILSSQDSYSAVLAYDNFKIKGYCSINE